MVIELISLLLTMAALKGMTGALAPFSYLVKLELFRQGHLVKLDDVRVPEKFQILNLPPDFSDHVETFDLLSVQDFDGHLASTFQVIFPRL